MVEAIICCQDWPRSTPLPFLIEKNGVGELENFKSRPSNSTMEPNWASLDD
ncbi:uncharacterized protein J3R85_018547 [Psidium guajava]|nr:uncharacterized protein J3R85_018547 [Psidium guajava]